MDKTLSPEEKNAQEKLLLANCAAKHSELEKLLAEVNDSWVYDDLVYRFYHQSFKVFYLQEHTLAIVNLLQSLAPSLPMNSWFAEIVAQGTGKEFKPEDNYRWLDATRPILEAFFHARYFLEMSCKYTRLWQEPPNVMPSGWAGFLHLFNLR
ncbi:MAG: hypothetical protein L0Y72_00705 [Gemmataceae bacterium]|nr:hypothetical protein [Gemmataceae bacterium]MCI0737530.1 hypothetical protein [Gemmataceae bacterium]